MTDLDRCERLLAERCFVEVAYLAGVEATASPSARAHLLAGVGCCGCVEPIAAGQRLLDDDPLPSTDRGGGGLRISPGTPLPYAGLDHLLEAFRADPALRAPESLWTVLDAVADDLAYVSRREIQRSPGSPRPRTHSLTCLMAAVLLRRLTGSSAELPRVSVDFAEEKLAEELPGYS